MKHGKYSKNYKNYCKNCHKTISPLASYCKSCVQKRNKHSYIDGRCLKNYYCNLCNKKISISSALYGNHTCKKCAAKEKAKQFIKHYYCKDCGKEISTIYAKRCWKCWIKFNKEVNNSNYKGGLPKCIDCSNKVRDRRSKRCKKCNNKFYIGKNHQNWKDGRSFEPYTKEWTEELRRFIRKRDKYICQKCGKKGKTVHHIDYNKKNCNKDNLITLCNKCNSKVNFNRIMWTIYFQEKIQEKKNAYERKM